MNGNRKATWIACVMTLIILAGCGGTCPQIPREALKDLPENTEPKAPERHTKKLIDAQGKPAGILFPTEDAFNEARYINDLQEWGRLGVANTTAANKIFQILRQPPKSWWQFWK